MSHRRVIVYVVGALVVGLVVGSLGIAAAAPSTGGTGRLGIRFGATARQAGATLADVVAKLTGKTVEDVRAERADGKSFTTIAGESGVSGDKVVDQTLAARKALLDSAVSSQQITQAQADAALARMKARLTTRIGDATACTGNAAGACGAGGCGGGRQGAGMGYGAGACGACTAAGSNQ